MILDDPFRPVVRSGVVVDWVGVNWFSRLIHVGPFTTRDVATLIPHRKFL